MGADNFFGSFSEPKGSAWITLSAAAAEVRDDQNGFNAVQDVFVQLADIAQEAFLMLEAIFLGFDDLFALQERRRRFSREAQRLCGLQEKVRIGEKGTLMPAERGVG